jgi:hypothetical protein
MNTTLFIKTFERPECCRNLIRSARQKYSDIPIVVIDDSKEPSDFGAVEYIRTDFDIGISKGRNMAASVVKTKYFFTCDDDNLFTHNTDLELAEKLLEANDLDMLTVMEIGNKFHGCYTEEGDTVIYSRENRGVRGDVTLYDFGPNLFLMRKDKVLEFPWDERLKTGEHFAYFHKHRGKLRVGFTNKIFMDHLPIEDDFYRRFRDRAAQYRSLYMKENGIAVIRAFGKTITA